MPTITPVEALNRIAFLLERSRASTYRVKAFRGASASIAGMSQTDLEHASRHGRLTDIKGVGKTSAEVIASALAGEIPDYLASLEDDAPKTLAEGCDQVMAAVKGDCHSHTDWSDGGSPLDLMAATAHNLGRHYLAVTDHSPSLRVANGLSAERLEAQRKIIDDLNSAYEKSGDDFRVLAGIEVDILDDGSLDQSEEMLAGLDIRVASVHGKLRSDAETMTKRMLGAIRNPHTTILGHCTGQLVEGSRGKRPASQFDADAVFAACAKERVAVEINARPERQDPPDDLIQKAWDAGCYFSLDSDAHAPGQLDFLDYGAARIQKLGLPLERVIATWNRHDLLAFARKEVA